MCVNQPYYMGCVCGGNIKQLLQLANSWALFSCDAHRLITSLQKQNKKPCNKQLINLQCLECTGKCQTWSIWQDLSLRFLSSSNVHCTSSSVSINILMSSGVKISRTDCLVR